jgi:hypothetical protein
VVLHLGGHVGHGAGEGRDVVSHLGDVAVGLGYGLSEAGDLGVEGDEGKLLLAILGGLGRHGSVGAAAPQLSIGGENRGFVPLVAAKAAPCSFGDASGSGLVTCRV